MPTLSLAEEAASRLARRKLAQRRPTVPTRPCLSPVDEALYQRCTYDLETFARHFFPHICVNDFNALHLDYYELQRRRQGSRGHRDVVAAPRGSSKTAGCATIGILHDCVYQTEQFILYLTNSSRNAELKVRDIRDELTDNAELLRIYGVQQGSTWNQGYFTTRQGVTVMAAGRGTQVRGLSKRFVRFTKIVCDDIEHPEEVWHEDQRDKTHTWLHNDILKLGQPTTNIEIWGTVLHTASELARLLTTAGWHHRLYQSVITFAEAASVPLWQQWREIFLDLSNPRNADDAQDFFTQHQAAMLRGAEVFWPDRQSYYALMVERLVEGDTAFWQEKQNQPLADSRYLFNMDAAGYCTLTPEGIAAPHGQVPWVDMINVAAYYDPALGRGRDYAACVVAAEDRAGYSYILDAYCTNTDAPDDQAQAIAALLWRWQVEILGIEVNGFQSLLPRTLRETIARYWMEARGRRWLGGFIPITHTGNKILRIKTLEALITNRWLVFNAHMTAGEYLRQFAEYAPVDGGGRDDGPDATEGVLAVLRGKYRTQDLV